MQTNESSAIWADAKDWAACFMYSDTYREPFSSYYSLCMIVGACQAAGDAAHLGISTDRAARIACGAFCELFVAIRAARACLDTRELTAALRKAAPAIFADALVLHNITECATCFRLGSAAQPTCYC